MLPAHLLIKPRAGFALSGWLWGCLRPELLLCSLTSRNAVQQRRSREQGEPVPLPQLRQQPTNFIFIPLSLNLD